MQSLFIIFILAFSVFAQAHGGAEGAGAQVGPDKGVTEKGPEGFKLSAEALKSIGIQFTEIKTAAPIPKEAVVHVKDEKSVFRSREGWIKRVSISTKDFKAGDKIAISQLGFLRIVEVYVSGGEAEEGEHND